jgi:hypothetical protein
VEPTSNHLELESKSNVRWNALRSLPIEAGAFLVVSLASSACARMIVTAHHEEQNVLAASLVGEGGQATTFVSRPFRPATLPQLPRIVLPYGGGGGRLQTAEPNHPGADSVIFLLEEDRNGSHVTSLGIFSAPRAARTPTAGTSSERIPHPCRSVAAFLIDGVGNRRRTALTILASNYREEAALEVDPLQHTVRAAPILRLTPSTSRHRTYSIAIKPLFRFDALALLVRHRFDGSYEAFSVTMSTVRAEQDWESQPGLGIGAGPFTVEPTRRETWSIYVLAYPRNAQGPCRPDARTSILTH